MKIDLGINEEGLRHAVERARERKVTIPTFNELSDPISVSESVAGPLKDVGLWEVNPLNIYRACWKNEPKPEGGGFGGVNYVEIPKEITGVEARIFALVGKWFPTGAHKVGAAFGCLVPRLVTGRDGAVRSYIAEGGLAIDGEFLPGRSLQFSDSGLRIDRNFTRGDEQGAV